MLKKSFYSVIIAVILLALTISISCKTTTVDTTVGTTEQEVTETTAAETVGEAEAVGKERPPAKPGDPITPTDFPVKLLPGIEKPGVVPDKQYFIVYSNGDMNDLWRLNHVKDMEKFGDMYAERFGIKFLWANAGNNSAKQLSDIESLLSMKPDLLIFSPNEAEPLAAVLDLCTDLQIPFITVDRGIAATPSPDSMYKCSISMDFLYQGVAQAKMIVEYLT